MRMNLLPDLTVGWQKCMIGGLCILFRSNPFYSRIIQGTYKTVPQNGKEEKEWIYCRL